MKIRFMKHISWCLVFAMFVLGIAPRVEAGIAPSDVIALSQVDRAADIDKIQAALETKMVRERLKKLGYAQEEINSKLAQLSDQQMHNLALQIDELKVGGDGLGIVIALLVIVILVVIVLQLMDHKVVVTK
ncbi:MAG: hypothetical protein C4550_06585 [Nitrospiraceae bacterium]|nr:MAG: hypothetical protein C4550_06585 [Nitrospiraceae bacterium]